MRFVTQVLRDSTSRIPQEPLALQDLFSILFSDDNGIGALVSPGKIEEDDSYQAVKLFDRCLGRALFSFRRG